MSEGDIAIASLIKNEDFLLKYKGSIGKISSKRLKRLRNNLADYLTKDL